MSCFMCSPETIGTIATFITYQYEDQYNPYTGDLVVPDALKDCMSDFLPEKKLMSWKVFNRLVNMNMEALKARYPESYKEMIDEALYDYTQFPNKDVDFHYTEMLRACNTDINDYNCPEYFGMLLKYLDCYIYQCEEGAVSESELFELVCQMRQRVESTIARYNRTYNETQWD